MQDPWGWCTGMARRGGVPGDVGGGVQGEERGTDAVLWGGWPPLEIKKFKLKKKKSYGKFSTLFNVSNKDALLFF